MFETMNPLDRSTAFFEIAIIILISFLLGYVVAKIPLGEKKKEAKKKKEIEEVDPRDIIKEPNGIMANLTRDRDGNAIDIPSGKEGN